MRLLAASVFVLTVALSSSAGAQDNAAAGASARAVPSTVEVGQTLRYEVDVSVAGSDDITIVKQPTFGGPLTLVAQPRPTTHFITINGVSERRLSLRYALLAMRAGKFSIRPPTFEYGGKRIRPDIVHIEVFKEGALNRPTKAPPKNSRFFIDTKLEPAERPPYVGEQVTLSYALFLDGSQHDVQPANSREPALDDFWIHDLTDRVPRSEQMVRIRGRLYKRASMWTYALFPLRAGPADIESAAVDLIVGGLFRGRKGENLESQPIKLDVQPLPPDAPAGFYEGNVGNWSFSVKADQNVTKVGRAFTVELNATGSGQVSRLRLPNLANIEHTRVTDEDEDSEMTVRGTTVGGTRTKRITLIPLKKGVITIPPIEFSAFDPVDGVYKTTRSEPLTVRVEPGEAGVAIPAPTEVAKRNVAADEDLIGKLLVGLADPPETADSEDEPDPARFPWLYWVLIAASILGFLGVFVEPYARRFARRAAPELERRARAQAAAELISQADHSPQGLAKAIRDALSAGWDIPAGVVTSREIADAFAKRELDEKAAQELARVLAQCESARFGQRGASLPNDAVERAKRAFQRLVAALAVLLALAGPARADEGDWRSKVDACPANTTCNLQVGTEAARAGDYAVARLALERAAYFSPWDSDVEQNRSIVERIVRLNTIEQSRTGRTMEGDEMLFWWRAASHTNPHVIAILAILLWLASAAVLRLRRRTGSAVVRDVAAVALGVTLLLAAHATVIAAGRQHVLHAGRPVVVMQGELEFREGPNLAAKKKRTPRNIVPGTMLRVVDERGEWQKVVWFGDAGWTRNQSLAEVAPAAADD